MTLTEFLLARIADDEEQAKAAAGATAWRSDGPGGAEAEIVSRAGEPLFHVDMEAMVRLDASTLALAEHFTRWLPGRVLADCESKRRIVELYQRHVIVLGSESDPAETGVPSAKLMETSRAALEAVLTFLALPYADHPDYWPEWRP